MKLSDYVMRRIAETGVRHVFMLPGGGCMHLVDSLGSCPDLEFVCNLHEQACAIAADAYAQYTNRLGVALVTTGPGGTNTITGVAAAWLESTPCLFLSGQVKRADLSAGRGLRQMGFQEINIVDIVRPITKYAVLVEDPLKIRYHLDKALFLARNGRRGPVWLDIPLDVQAAEIDESSLESYQPDLPPEAASQRVAAGVADAIDHLNQAERPVVLAGNGIRLSGAFDDFLELTEVLRVPVLTTWKAIDFLPEEHPLYIGRPGAVGQRAANFAQQNADWLLVLGARLDLGQTAYNHAAFARGAYKVVVDVDEAEIRKLQMKVDLPLCADAGEVIRTLLARSGHVLDKDRSAWWDRCRQWKARYPVLLPQYWEETVGVSNYALIEVLSECLGDGDLLVPGSSGASSEVTMQAFRVNPGVRILNSQGLGPMGFGLSAAIGACLASGRRRTVCIEGDGGLQMNSQELETVHRLNLPIKLFVLDNQGYASIRSTQRAYFQGRFVASGADSGLTLPNTLKLAAAYGLPATEICSHANLRAEVRHVLEHEGAIVCNVRISPNQATAPRVMSERRPDGTMVSRPMEDLWPPLDREEFLANMIVPPVRE